MRKPYQRCEVPNPRTGHTCMVAAVADHDEHFWASGPKREVWPAGDRHFANYRGPNGDTLSITVEDGTVTMPETGLDAMLAAAGYERVE